MTMSVGVNRGEDSGLSDNAVMTNGRPLSYLPPSKPGYYSTPVPRSVIYAHGDPDRIETLLPYFNHTANHAKSLVILKDPNDPKRPLFVITSLRTRFFPTGTWTAYLYQDKRTNGLFDRLQGSLTLYLEPAQLPSWFTWRFLARYLRGVIDSSNTRHLRIPQGVMLNPTQDTILSLGGEAGEHNRPGLSGVAKTSHGQQCPMVTPPTKGGLTPTRFVRGKLSGMTQSWLLWEQRKLCAVANGQASVSSPSIMGRHRGTSTASSDSVATQST
ncbi:hypothetical protein ES708_23897 [subsurface metagenome]